MIKPDLSFETKLIQLGYKCIAGVDESGRGPLAGPVVAAAVIMPENIFLEGVRDSKLLSHKQREKLSHTIKEAAIAWGVGIVDVAEIEQINILQASLKAMRIAVESLILCPDYILIDGIFTIPKLDQKQEAIKKGDKKSFSIACASIVAKVTRDNLMFEYDKRFPQYGFGSNKGYPTQKHREALKHFGPCEIHRKTFHGVLEEV